jgi:hypothetical protein
MTTGFQIQLVAQSMKDRIAKKLVERLQQIPSLRTVEFDRVRLRADDFMSVDCPAVQVIDVAETIEHEGRRAKKTWSLALELVMRGTADQPISQRDLWNLQYEVERMLWGIPNLGIPGMIHLRYLGSQTDLHLLDPYFFARLDLEAIYYEPLVSDA